MPSGDALHWPVCENTVFLLGSNSWAATAYQSGINPLYLKVRERWLRKPFIKHSVVRPPGEISCIARVQSKDPDLRQRPKEFRPYIINNLIE
jgi:hypothetical protein